MLIIRLKMRMTMSVNSSQLLLTILSEDDDDDDDGGYESQLVLAILSAHELHSK